jgi:hypothetical protein
MENAGADPRCLRWRAWTGLSTPTQGIVMLHSAETAGARTRASASDDNAQSAATAVTVRIKIFSSGNFASGTVARDKVQIAKMHKAAKTPSFYGRRCDGFHSGRWRE